MDVDDVIDVNERLLAYLFKEALGVEVSLPIQRMTWQEAMDRFGSDKPDLRFGMELKNVSEAVKDFEFGVFQSALALKDGSVRGINAKGQGAMPRKKIDKLVEFAKGYGAKGPGLHCHPGGRHRQIFLCQVPERRRDGIPDRRHGGISRETCCSSPRTKIRSSGMCWELSACIWQRSWGSWTKMNSDSFGSQSSPCWSGPMRKTVLWPCIIPSPCLWRRTGTRSIPIPAASGAKAYDIVLNGNEIGGGSVRIHQDDIQEKMFEVLGFTKEQAWDQFGFLLSAFKYGVPPHAGLAYGLDRLVMLMAKQDSIRDVIAFPKVKDASDLMCEAPSRVDEKQLQELGIRIAEEE